MKKLLGVLLVLILIAVGVVGYLGFIPGVSALFGSDKPRNLGVSYVDLDLQSAQGKTAIETISLGQDASVKDSIRFEGQKDLTISMNSQELTSLSNNRPWRYYPLSNVQIKVNPDGSSEASGIADINMVLKWVEGLGFSVDDANKALDDYKIPRIKTPFYVSGKGSVENGKVTLSLSSVEVGRLKVPQNIVSDNTGRVISAVEAGISKVQGLSIKKLNFENGQMNFDGTVPAKKSIVPR